MPELRSRVFGKDLDGGSLGADPESFLRSLGAPALVEVPGRDHSRLRVVTTLLHGNEPSGLRALHRWLAHSPVPATDLLLFFGAVDAALAAPGFAHRFLPGARDLNRVWCEPFEGEEGRLAAQVLERLRERPPECLVDLHNNTGQNPAYGVAFRVGVPELNLVSLYARRIIHTPIRLGTIVEATSADWPSVTVECGRSGDPAADELAFAGTRRLLEADDLELGATPPPIEVVVDPVRVRVRPGVPLGFGDGPGAAGLVVSREIDRHNFELLPAGTCIGWLSPGSDWPIEAVGAGERDRSFELFAVAGDRLETRTEMIPVMMTTNRENALADCLFYVAWPERRLG